MEKLKSFRKNGLDYKLLDRTDRVALFEQKIPEGGLAGYEVCVIYHNQAGFRFNKIMPESESITGNEQFGYDDSKAFFPFDLERTKEYFKFVDKVKMPLVMSASKI
jgi:hypothetical protein